MLSENCVQLRANIRAAREFLEQMPSHHQFDRIDINYMSQIMQALKKQVQFLSEAYEMGLDKGNCVQKEF